MCTKPGKNRTRASVVVFLKQVLCCFPCLLTHRAGLDKQTICLSGSHTPRKWCQEKSQHQNHSCVWRMHTRLKHFLLFSNPCELGAHLLCFFNEAGLQHVLGTLGVDEAVSSVQGLSLVHPPSCFLDVAGVLQGRKQRKRQGECKYARCQNSFYFMLICLY